MTTREQMSAHQRAFTARRSRAGLCVDCAAPCRPMKSCLKCRRARAERRQKRIARGKCYICGGPRGKYAACEPCLTATRQRRIDREAAHLAGCSCGHSVDDHRPRGGECLEDDCRCTAFAFDTSEAAE